MNLRLKFIMPIVAITATMSFLTFSLISRHLEQDALRRAKHGAAEYIASKAREMIDPESFHDTDFRRQSPVFEAFMQKIRTSELLKIKVLNTKFDIIFSTTTGDIGTKTDSSLYRHALEEGAITGAIKPPVTEKANIDLLGYRQLMEFYVPIVYHGRIEGVIEGYYRMDDINESVASTSKRVMSLIALFGAVVCAAVYLMLTRIVVHPINALTIAANTLASGKPGASLPYLGTADEIGALRDALLRVLETADPHRKKHF